MGKVLVASVAFSLLVAIAQPVFADDSFTICKGELDDQCNANIKIGCTQSEDPPALANCAVYGPNGKHERNYRKVQISSEGGNQCGYTTWQITCLSN